MSGDQSSSDEDDWAVEELPLPALKLHDNSKEETDQGQAADDGEDDWEQAKIPGPKKKEIVVEEKEVPEGEPMILVDLTELSKGKIHSKFDRNSVNDTEAASKWRRKIEGDYESYAKDNSLLSEGTVIPCGSSVWRTALITLRAERDGHYFVPIFPPKR